MKSRVILWLARGLTILYIFLFFILSLDVFEGPQSAWNKFGGFLIHNIPVVLLIILMVYTWRRSLLSGLVFILFGIFTIFFFRTTEKSFYVFMSISLPIILTGLLYIIAWYMKRKETSAKVKAGKNNDVVQ